MTQVLKAIDFPLRGSRLIEASAGTGKTWTIAALYLRLVLGHGGEQAFARPLAPADILVMTFTRAATRELSQRIRTRLLQAARCFRGEDMPDADDTFLAELVHAYADVPARRHAAWRLATAAQGMDDAAVLTIDAWCHRMLHEHAFDSGSVFDETLEANSRLMQLEAAQDYWRQQLYPLSDDALALALSVWPTVSELDADASALAGAAVPQGQGQGSLGDLIDALSEQRQRALGTLKQGWVERVESMRAWIEGQWSLADSAIDKKKLQLHRVMAWLAALALWAGDSQLQRPAISDIGIARLRPAGLQASTKAGRSLDVPAEFQAFDQLMLALDQLPALANELRSHAAHCIAERLAELKLRAGSFGFDDMLNRLDQALDPTVHGERARRLRQRILAQYPVAMVDEFQDTSPIQARILDRLYGISHNDPATALLLIGDPKQSIYGFRGADIHSYLAVRHATEGRHYVLGTNHRSTVALVAAVNHLFEQAETRLSAGEGAFMFRSPVGRSSDNPVPFLPVQARGRAEQFVSSGGPAHALSLELDTRLLDKTRSQAEFAARCAEHIVVLLNDSGAGFVSAQGFARLQPADIAVLVRTGRHAAAVRRELQRRRVASVYLSDRDSVFDSDEARDLLHWLKAVAAPGDVRLARAGLATNLLGLSIEELKHLATDDGSFDVQLEHLRQLHRVWQEQGVLTMLRQSLHRFAVPARWLGIGNAVAPGGSATDQRDGERRLTNVLHLAELLQGASAQLVGEHALIHWLASQREGRSSAGDEQIVRLESDADLVKVVTVHKSKGLEYPLVFLPFPCDFRAITKARSRFVQLADASGRRVLNLDPGDAEIAAADKERLREDLRLLYVAATRARFALWVGLAALKQGNSPGCTWHRSAMGYLLGGAEAAEPAALAGQVGAVLQHGVDIAWVAASAPDRTGRTQLQPRDTPTPLHEAAPYAAQFDRRWSIGSFSALTRALPTIGPWASSAAAVRSDESSVADAEAATLSETLASPETARVELQPWSGVPSGPAAGSFLHDQLEWLAGEDFALARSAGLQRQLLLRCERVGWARHAAVVVNWLARVVRTPLPGIGAALEDITQRLPEMEFWLPSQGLQAQQVDALCRSQLLNRRDRPALPERVLHGMLMGFADLVFEHAGRYWVLDYKSNHLGPRDADYGEPALEAAMATHRYDVQAAVYLLALHRLLRARLGARYEPSRQLGGALYLFVRGIDATGNGCYVVPASQTLWSGMDAMLGRADGSTS